MRYIDKSSHEPPELLRFRKTGGPNCSYDDFPDKDALRQRLLEDQGFLCCYCMGRIEKDKMRIEHYLSRSGHRGEQLVWRNLLGACRGGEGEKPPRQTCDYRKGEKSISINPLNQGHMAQVRYLPSGKIQHGEGNTPFQRDIDDTLNLNIERLKEVRIEALKGFQGALEKDLRARWTDARLKRKLTDLRSGRPLVPFLGLLEYWIEKRIGR